MFKKRTNEFEDDVTEAWGNFARRRRENAFADDEDEITELWRKFVGRKRESEFRSEVETSRPVNYCFGNTGDDDFQITTSAGPSLNIPAQTPVEDALIPHSFVHHCVVVNHVPLDRTSSSSYASGLLRFLMSICICARRLSISTSTKGSKTRDLYKYATKDTWDKSKSIFDESPDMIRTPLTANGDTALHIAVSANSNTSVQQMVNLMSPEDLEIRNSEGNTAFRIAAISGNDGCIDIMIAKNENLPLIRGHDDMLPVHLAALNGHHKIVQHLSTGNFLREMAPNSEDIERLFFMTIRSSMYDVAMKLFEIYGDMLAIARDEEKLTALHMLAQKPPGEFYMQGDNNKEASSGSGRKPLQLLFELWYRIRQLEYTDLITKPSMVLFDAVKSGNFDVVELLLHMNPELLAQKDSHGRNLLHITVLYRRYSFFNHIVKKENVNLLIRAVDNERNNILHLAANESEGTLSRLNTKLHREISLFKEVAKRVPRELSIMRNNKGETPSDIFYAKYKELSKEVKKEAKGIANSGMLVATLIATVVFAAALTVPGDKSNAWFVVFILTDAVALFTSAASIISFLSIFTSTWFTENKFIITQLPSLIYLGLSLLFISIVTMVIAFAAASFLIFDQISKWVAFVVASLGLLPILVFLVLQFSLFDGLFDHFLWSRI